MPLRRCWWSWGWQRECAGGVYDYYSIAVSASPDFGVEEIFRIITAYLTLLLVLLDFLHQSPLEQGHEARELCSEPVQLFPCLLVTDVSSFLYQKKIMIMVGRSSILALPHEYEQCHLHWYLQQTTLRGCVQFLQYPLKRFPFCMALSATDSTQTGSRKLSSNCLLHPVSLARSHLWHPWLKRLLCSLDLAIFQWLLAGNSISTLVCYWGLLDRCRSSVCLSF